MATIAGSSSANTLLFDRAVRHAIYLERFKGSEVKTLVAAYRELERDLLAQLAKRDPTAVKGRYTRARLLKLLDDVRDTISGFSKQLELDFTGRMRELAEFESVLQVKMLEGAVPVGIDWSLPAVPQVKAAVFAEPMQGRLLKEWFASLNAVTQDRVKASIRLGVLEGQGIREIGARISSAVGMARRGAEMVARTAVNHVSVVARQAVFEDNAEVMKGVRWVATLDGRTSPVCRARDGEVFPIDSGPRPPAHPNCRSSISPVLKSWRELGFNIDDAPEATRASMDGQVPASMTYSEWLKSQSAAAQDEILGPTRGALFRRGGLPLEKFVMADGTELTLRGLAAQYPEAFVKAGQRPPRRPGELGLEELLDQRLITPDVLDFLQEDVDARSRFVRSIVASYEQEQVRPKTTHPILSTDEQWVLRAYSGSVDAPSLGGLVYQGLNARLRAGELTEEVRKLAALAHVAVSKLPSASERGLGFVYAGKPAREELFRELQAAFTGQTPFEFRQLQSTSRKETTALGFAGYGEIDGQTVKGILFRIRSPDHAFDIESVSMIPREEEFLVPFGQRFRVLSIGTKNGYVTVEMKEFDTP